MGIAKGVRDLIRRAAKGSSWSHFVGHASPALFEVMPLRALLAQGKEFVSNGSDARRYAKVRENIGRWQLQTPSLRLKELTYKTFCAIGSSTWSPWAKRAMS